MLYKKIMVVFLMIFSSPLFAPQALKKLIRITITKQTSASAKQSLEIIPESPTPQQKPLPKEVLLDLQTEIRNFILKDPYNQPQGVVYSFQDPARCWQGYFERQLAMVENVLKHLERFNTIALINDITNIRQLINQANELYIKFSHLDENQRDACDTLLAADKAREALLILVNNLVEKAQ